METIDTMNHEQDERPKFLTVLCILTFISTGLSFIFGLFNTFITGKQSEEAMLNSKVEMAKATNDLKDMGMTGLADMMEKFERMSTEINENFYLAGTIGLLTTAIGLFGAYKMWNGAKMGFHAYIIYNLMVIGGIYLYVSPGNIPSIVVIINVILSGIFVFMYSRNLKWLK